MVSTKVKAAVLALVSGQTSYALTATILADTNRDGTVDVTGDSDVAGKDTWTADRGALFLPNIGDTDGRCSAQIGNDYTTMHICNDASDNVLRQSRYLASVVTLPIAGLSANAVGYVNITETAAAEKVRIFLKEGDDEWTYVDEDRQFTAEQLGAGLQLGVDGRDVRRVDVWDGKATVQFSVSDGGETATDSVQMRVAPYLTHHHAQEAQQLFGARARTGLMTKFAESLVEHNAAAGIEADPIFIDNPDIWVQDFFEPGYASIPGPDGPVVLRLMLLSYQRRAAGKAVFQQLRSATVGAVSFPQSWTQDQDHWGDTWDATGNLETIPPYSFGGKEYPAGRIIMGEGAETPLALPFLRLQGLQDPIVLDTSWLGVGHVDEFVQFLPAANARGWVLVADDPLAGVALLKAASAAGHGGAPALSRPSYEWDVITDPCVPKSTIDFELARPNVDETNAWAAERIQYNIDIIKRETGITDDEIIRVPGFVKAGSKWTCGNSLSAAKSTGASAEEIFDIVAASQSKSPDALQRRQAGAKVHAHYPAAINGVVLSDSYYMSPNPWGPVIDGVDIFAEAVKAAYAKANYTVGFIDTWFTHHRGGGEVHCGTNVWREADSVWW